MFSRFFCQILVIPACRESFFSGRLKENNKKDSEQVGMTSKEKSRNDDNRSASKKAFLYESIMGKNKTKILDRRTAWKGKFLRCIITTYVDSLGVIREWESVSRYQYMSLIKNYPL